MPVRKKINLIGIFTIIFMHVTISIVSKENVELGMPVQPPVLDEFIRSLKDLTNDSFAASGAPGAAVAVVKNGQVVYMEGLGVKQVNTADSVDAHTAFRLASVSKTLTGTLTGILAEEHKLSWDDPVQTYLPAFKLSNTSYTEQLKVRHLLSQSTGLIQHAFTDLIEEGKDLQEMMDALSEVKLMAEPGSLFSYQNVAFGVIEPVVQAATGQSYELLMQNKLFEPLGMRDASMDYGTFVTRENKALPHQYNWKGWTPVSISSTYYNVPSAGGINASITDMANYMIALTGHRPEIIRSELLAEIFRPQIKTNIRWKYFSRWKKYKKSYYGMGWRIVENGDDCIAYHGGYVNGYRSQLAVNFHEDVAICVLTNSGSSFSSKLVPAFLDLYDAYKWRLRIEESRQIQIEPSS
jgi:beta-lactamase class C